MRINKHALMLAILFVAGSLAADIRPRVNISAGWAGSYRLDKNTKNFYSPFTMAPHGRIEVRLVDNLAIYCAGQYSQETGNSFPAGSDEIKLKSICMDYGIGYRIGEKRIVLMPHGGITFVHMKEIAFGESEKRTIQGYHAGIKLNLYLGESGYFMMLASYSSAKIVTHSSFDVGGVRFQVGLGTHIRLFESIYSDD